MINTGCKLICAELFPPLGQSHEREQRLERQRVGQSEHEQREERQSLRPQRAR